MRVRKIPRLAVIVIFVSVILTSIGITTFTREITLAAAPISYFVSPKGSDSNPGTLAKPFLTLDHARAVVRKQANAMSSDITVYLRGGTYQLSQALQFTAVDSGMNGHNIIYSAYQNEKPVISGGRRITGWKPLAGTAIWQAHVDANVQTRQLYVNGVRAVRANATGGIAGNVTQTDTGYITDDTLMQKWHNQQDIEFVYTGGAANSSANWVENRCGVASITGDAHSTTIAMKQPCYKNGLAKKSYNQNITKPTSIENAFELLKQPGQWYLNHASGIVSYIPRTGENLNTAEVIVPTLERLVEGQGSSEKPIHNIQFKGMTFAYATWLTPNSNTGFVEIQANYHADSTGHWDLPSGNVSFQGAHNLRFERNTFIHLGDAGLRLWNGSQNNIVIGNVFTDISSSGVIIGSVNTPRPTDKRLYDDGNQVLNNYIHQVAVEYHGAAGLFGGYLSNTVFAHNELSKLPYSGISLGWGWGAQSYAQNNQILANNIHDDMKLLFDGGGIYTLSEQGASATQKRSKISGNYIHDQGQEFGAIYPDEGSAYFDITKNVVSSVPRWLHIWTGSIHDITVENNYSDTQTMTQSGTNITMNGNITSKGQWPQEAQNIIKNAGIEASYRGILNGINP